MRVLVGDDVDVGVLLRVGVEDFVALLEPLAEILVDPLIEPRAVDDSDAIEEAVTLEL